MRFPAEITLSCILVAILLLIELFYTDMPMVRSVGRAYGDVITKISRMGRLPHFLRYAATRAWSSAFKRALEHSPRVSN